MIVRRGENLGHVSCRYEALGVETGGVALISA